MLTVSKIIALRDNYVYFIKDENSGMIAIVDPSEPMAVLEHCMREAINPQFILNTHHHWDHTGGNLSLKNAFDLKIVGYVGDAHRIPGIDITLDEGDCFKLGNSSFNIMHVPGHTTGHIAFYTPEDKMLFCGDSMFSMGCGGNFEGTYAQLYSSLKRYRALPRDTKVFCGHEYTKAGWRFARKVEGETEALRIRGDEILAGHTVPSTIGTECDTNPFLRWDSPLIRRNLGLSPESSDFEVFCAVRSL